MAQRATLSKHDENVDFHYRLVDGGAGAFVPQSTETLRGAISRNP